MNTAKKVQGLALAAAAAALFTGAPATMADGHGGHGHAGMEEGKCMGANSCKGQSACATAQNACQGMNACKGQGYLKMTKAECDKAGGSFEPMKK